MGVSTPLALRSAPVPRGVRAGARAGGTGVPGKVATVRDADAAELFAAYYPTLAGWCRRLVDDTATAHDLASEAFARLLGRWGSVEDPRAFLYVVATNLVRDHWRRTQRERRALLRLRAQTRQSAGPAGGVELRTLVESLPDRLRAPVLLHYYADIPIAEVARLLGRPDGTVKSDLFKARALLRAELDGPAAAGTPPRGAS